MDKDTVFKIVNPPFKFKDLSALAMSYVSDTLNQKEKTALKYRAKQGLTQEQTAEEVDRCKNTIYNWENSACKKCSDTWESIEWIGIFIEILKKEQG